MFNRILVPTDFSAPSTAALDQARTLAERLGSSIQLLHVVEEPATASGYVADGFAPATDSIRETRLAQARDALARLISATDRTRFHARADAIIGAPAAAIVDYADATGTTLIVMGTHGRTGLAHLLMGSVAEHVVRTASCAVLIVRHLPIAHENVLALDPYCAPLPS